MTRLFKSSLLAGLTLLLHAYANAQQTSTQNTVKLFFEKVYIHTDRTLYAPGDDLWLKAYVVNARDNHLIGTSKNLYIELISPADSIVTKEILLIDNGTAKGDFALPGKLPGGTYRLRAYTNWMRNFGDNFIFEKTIAIAGNKPTERKSAAATQIADGGLTKQATTATTPVIRFFPEGGALVNEITSIVAVKAEDAAGNGISISAPVISAAGDTVAHFTCDSLGMGLFTLLPISGQTYHSSVKYKGQIINSPLPQPLSNDLTLKTVQKDTSIYVTITCNNAGAAIYTGKQLTLGAKHGGATYFEQQLQLSNNQIIARVPVSILPEGITAFTLYDDEHKPHCERLVYIDHPGKAKLSISTAKTSYQSREKITVNIRAANDKQAPLTGNFSLAVVDAGISPADDSNIKAYMLLQSEIKGNIAHAGRYFDTTNINRSKQLDLLLLTQGWRDFVWRRLANTAIKISYLPEQGFTLTGRVKEETGKKPVPDANITLSAPRASGQHLFFTKTDAAGNFYFDNLKLSGTQNIRVNTRDDKAKANGIIELDSLSKHGLPVNKLSLSSSIYINSLAAAEIQKRSILNKQLDSVINLKEVKVNASRNIVLRDQIARTAGYPDEVFTVKNTDSNFKTLKDYILYYSKQAKPDPNSDQVVFFADGGTYKPRIILDNKEAPFSEDDPDDMQARYYTAYYNLPIEQVEKVVIKRLLAELKPPPGNLISNTKANAMGNSVMGPAASTAIKPIFVIYLTLKPGAMFRNGGGITTADIQGYYEARTFYKPLHGLNDANASKPDQRVTIHWEPEIKTDNNGQATVTFYNADPKSTINVIVNGVSANGEPLYSAKSYIVK